jgi:CysZ protein
MLLDFFSGLAAYPRALQLISKLKLWKYIFLPGIIGILLAAAIFTIAYGLSDDLGSLLIRLYPWEWGSNVVGKIAEIFGGLLILAIGLIVFKQLVMVVTGPFMSPLSEKIEQHLSGVDNKNDFSLKTTGYQVVRGVRIASRNLFWELFLTIILLIMGLIPVLSLFSIVGIFLVQAYYFGFGNLDFALERRHGVSGTIQFVKHHKGMALGNGVLTTLLLMTVIGFLFILPIGVVAATIELHKKDKSMSSFYTN